MNNVKNYIWDEASVFLGLDCASGILELLPEFNMPPVTIRGLIREASLKNCQKHISAIAQTVQEVVSQNSSVLWTELASFVETKFACAARDKSAEERNALKFFDAANFDESKCIRLAEAISVHDLRREVNQLFDNALAEKIYYYVINTERELVKGHISDWDQEVLKRHANIGEGNGLLKIFIETFEICQKLKIYNKFILPENFTAVENILN